MAIRRYYSNADTTITNAYTGNLTTRGSDANMGQSDILEVFTIYAQADATSTEQARILIKFPIDEVAADIAAKKIPNSSVKYYLKLFNAPHSATTPVNFTVEVARITQDWEEGYGLDMEEYGDSGTIISEGTGEGEGGVVSSGVGATWNSAAQLTWAGGAYDSGTSLSFTFVEGYEELELDITTIVDDWLANTYDNYGLIIKLDDSHEGSNTSFYTKRFFARGTEYFYEKPVIEARWDSAEKDDRSNFYAESNLRSSTDNENILLFKNYVNGAFTNIPTIAGANVLEVKFYTSSTKDTEITPSAVSVDNTVDGIYKATVVLDTVVDDVALSEVYVVWQDTSPTPVIFHTETVSVKYRTPNSSKIPTYVTAIQNFKNSYSSDETARFRLFTRLKDWNPTIYTVATKKLEPEIVETAYYRIVRVVDDLTVIDYGIEGVEYTKLSYDKDGSYFDLDMSLFEKGWSYRIEFMYGINGELRQQPETFKFRVE